MPEIYISYNINDKKSMYNPGDIISGIFTLENRYFKEQKLKKVIIKYVEYYSLREHILFKHIWSPIMKTLKETVVDKGRIIKAYEKLNYSFKFKMPSEFKERNSPKIKDWKLILCFFEKTGLVSTTGAEGNGVFEVPIKI
ncbi:MAG: hypothetical protein JXA99_13065 [Candidatus Lokiarchaeota archaeon]|nr:hypothetical protein [Candidatus Lokiarchaeota archaeon]